MMLPATANRYQPALAVIQAGTFVRERAMREDVQAVSAGMRPLGGMAQAAPTPPKDMQAINEHYFGVSLTPMEAMFAMIEKAVGHLNDKMGVGSDGDPKSVEAGSNWRGNALIKNVGVGSADDFRIPNPGENGVSFRSVAKMILDRFKSEFLSGDSDLRKLLEETVGFRLNGMSIADLFTAIAEPESDAAKRVYETISEGLAGQAGSKASQRLDMAALGPLSTEETLAAQKNSSFDIVDEETIAEDQEAVRNAKAQEKLEEASEAPEKLREALEEALAVSGARHADSTQIALAMVQALSGRSEVPPTISPTQSDDNKVGETDVDITLAAKDNATMAADEPTPDQRSNELRGLLAHYLEFIDGSDFDKKRRFSTRP
jgi:hypothetical protein